MGLKRSDDATFELNLAPFLDIIVSIIPMLLLSVAFVQIKMIEAPTPQVINETTETKPPKPQAQVMLRVSNKSGFVFEITAADGKTSLRKIANAGDKLNFDELLSAAIAIKEQNPEINQLQLLPEEDVSFDIIVKVMDQVRQRPQIAKKVSLTEAATAKPVENSYLFPDVIFASVGS